jgi:hypothetical protein
MPINGLTGRVRTPRWAKIRLGYKKKGNNGNYPHDTDVFVLRREGDSEITNAILKAYGAQRVPDPKATEEVYSLGRQIRLMLPWEFDTVHEGREVSLELSNRSWAASKLRCSGDGGGADPELVGTAVCRDPQYLSAFERAGLVIGEAARGGHTVTCRGQDCPLWHTNHNRDTNRLPGCHREMRLQALLLHPATDPEDPNFMTQLGWIEVATGSWNGAVDVQSGLAMLRATVGRTHHVPFTLRRIARSISTPEGRAVKATLIVSYDMAEALRFGLGPPARAMIPGPLRRELLELAAAEAQFDSVADIQPQPERARLALPPAPQAATPASPPGPAIADRDDAVEAEQRDAEEGSEDEDVRMLIPDERDALKVACGGTPGQPDTLGRFRELVEASYRAVQVPADRECARWIPYPERRPNEEVQSGWLTTRHRTWIEERLREQRPEVDRDDASPEQAMQGELIDPAGGRQ